jgi:hypothetical protein
MTSELTIVNHFVPRWYQHQFIPDSRSERKYHYLDLKPERIPKVRGGYYIRDELRFLGPASCFKQDHLYTLHFGEYASDIIEKKFFGKIDDRGKQAVQFFHEWEFNEKSHEMLHNLMFFMDAQKLRTPKGLDNLKLLTGTDEHKATLYVMRSLWQMNITIWMEGVWEIFCCDSSETKLIVTDHPITTYNKALFPLSKECAYPRDAPIEALGTHTLFPLGPNRLLVITNLGYVRNPWAVLTKRRENPRYFSETLKDVRHIQTGRYLSEREVQTVNFILKNRARRYIAAAELDWLYPEKQLPTRLWNKLGDQFFLMPDPRKVPFILDTIVGYKEGYSWGIDEYGRSPQKNSTETTTLREKEWIRFQKHQKIWNDKFGELSSEELCKYI